MVSDSGKTEMLSLCFCLSVCLSFYLSFVWLIVRLSVHPSVCPSVLRLSLFLSFLPSFYLFFLFFILFFSSRISRLNGKFGIIFSSRNPGRDRELFQVPENEHREGFGNCFHENFGNFRDMTGELWCLLCSLLKWKLFSAWLMITDNWNFINWRLSNKES